MSKFYYPNNEILLPKWSDPAPRRSLVPWILGALVLLALLALAAWLLWLGPERNVQQATVMVLVDQDGDGKPDAQGSGVFISGKGYVLTNRHVVEPGGQGAAKIEVWYRPGSPARKKMDATLERAGDGEYDTTPDAIRNDWAVLRVATTEKLPAVPLAQKGDFREEESVRAYGFPRAPETATNEYGPSVKVVQGIINRVDRSAQGGVVRLTHSATTAEGMSGGPVTQRGKLVGINTSVLAGGATSANENYALPAYLLKESVFASYAH